MKSPFYNELIKEAPKLEVYFKKIDVIIVKFGYL